MIPTDHFSLIITMFFSQNFVKRNIHILEANGQSYRLQDSKRRLKRQ